MSAKQPEFGTALAEAKAAGVRVLFLLCRVGRDTLGNRGAEGKAEKFFRKPLDPDAAS